MRPPLQPSLYERYLAAHDAGFPKPPTRGTLLRVAASSIVLLSLAIFAAITTYRAYFSGSR